MIEIVGGPGAGAGDGVGAGVATGGVGDVGVVDEAPLEQAAQARIENSTRARIGVYTGGATGAPILTLSQRRDGIYRGGSPGGQEAGQQRHHRQQRGNGDERQRIERADAVDQA